MGALGPVVNGKVTAQSSNRLNNSGVFAPGNSPTKSTIPYTNTLAAAGQNGSTLTVPLAGDSFYVSASNGGVTIQPGGGDANTYALGTGLNVLDVPFSQLIFTNPNAFPITFTVVVGFAEFIDKRLVLINGTVIPTQDAPTIASGSAALVLAQGGGHVIFPGVSVAAFRRRQFIVYNSDGNGNPIHIYDSSGGNIMGIVPAGTSWTLAVSGAITVQNDNAASGNITVYVGETFYTS